MTQEVTVHAVAQLAEALLEAEERRQAIDPLTDFYPNMTEEWAYRVQLAIVEGKLGRGLRIVGKKIGLTSRAMQQMLGVNQPDYGHILDAMVWSEGEPVPLDRLIQPKCEGEVAFVLGEDIQGPGVNLAQVLKATRYVIPVIEIIDSRVRDWRIKLADTIADNASSAMVVLGGRALPPRELDLRLTGMLLERNGQVVATAAGAAVMGHPAAAVAWLANKLALFDITLRAGEIVLAGAFCGAVTVGSGDAVTATFDHLGSVTARFV